ncbi:hypothetical protein [Sphingomonas aracearum]|uniref:hypothetical protein n=1 Tax=Sphingomonas aracearum TaxID=2283317 RepID=UPI0011C01BC4|nr:hypothetical protein [Sphingomonas aracearum]
MPTFVEDVGYQRNYEQAQSFGRCISTISGNRARSLLRTQPNSNAERIALGQLGAFAMGCGPGGYRLFTAFVRGGISEALYRRTLGTGSTSPATPTRVAQFRAAESSRVAPALSDDRSYTMLAQCLVSHAPQATKGYLFSTVGSPGELAALNFLIGAATGCTDGKLLPADAPRAFLRSYIAEAAYRWTTFETGNGQTG